MLCFFHLRSETFFKQSINPGTNFTAFAFMGFWGHSG